jgi:UDP-N-acetylglucosamine diphosphorylase/glucosamine-1-phosphate N-acetyltransferase
MKCDGGGDLAVIILAAGLGTRMKSSEAKVLHKILDRPMIEFVIKAAKKVAGNNIVVVIGHQADKVREVVSKSAEVRYAIQEKPCGTGHAVLCAMPHLPENIKKVVVLCGDVPLLSSDTIHGLIENHEKYNYDISIIAVETDNPKGYGRIMLKNKQHVSKIVEEADATEEQKKIKIINTGTYCVNNEYLQEFLKKIKTSNAQEEFYLTDIIEIGDKAGKVVGVMIGDDPEEFIGINTREDLMRVEDIMRRRSM